VNFTENVGCTEALQAPFRCRKKAGKFIFSLRMEDDHSSEIVSLYLPIIPSASYYGRYSALIITCAY
jgi:hypothetical protein